MEINYFLSIKILFLMISPTHSRDFKCGKPGHTPVCVYDDSRDSYYAGEEVQYYCKERDKCYILGRASRFCLQNGTWSGSIPTCYSEVEFRVTPEFHRNLLVDKNKSTCVRSLEGVWELEFERLTTLSIIKIDIPMNSTVTIEAFALGINKTYLCGRTANYSGLGSALILICPPKLYGYTAKIVQKTNSRYFKLCEIAVYSSLGEAGCLKADTPLNGLGQKKIGNPTTYEFKCQTTYELHGKNKVECRSDGTWSQTSAICKKIIECETNPSISHGKVTMLDGNAFYGSRLHIQCDSGLQALRRCQSNASWENLDICIETNCGVLPTFLQESNFGQWVYLNNSSNTLLMLICEEGFYIEGLPPVLQCLSNGSWSSTTATCRRPLAAAPSTILLSATSASLCLLSLTICIFMFKRRRHLKSNTAIFHVSKTDSTSLNNPPSHSTNTAYEEVELQHHIKPDFPLTPNLTDVDPVYAQPFETPLKNSSSENKEDFYATHIYSEPVKCKLSPNWTSETSLEMQKFHKPEQLNESSRNIYAMIENDIYQSTIV